MKKEKCFEYLSDQELEELIAMVEQKELVAVPPDLEERILTKLEAKEENWKKKYMEEFSDSRKSCTEKQKEFRSYCFRVITSVAAAVIMTFTVPSVLDMISLKLQMRQEMDVSQFYRDREFANDHLPEQVSYPTREEVLREWGIYTERKSRESILKEESWYERLRR